MRSSSDLDEHQRTRREPQDGNKRGEAKRSGNAASEIREAIERSATKRSEDAAKRKSKRNERSKAGAKRGAAERLGPSRDSRRASRRERYRALELLRVWSSRGGAKECMTAAGSEVEVTGHKNGVVHTSGVKRCASAWACPVCAPTVRSNHAKLVDLAAREWMDRGGRLWFVTATLPHSQGESLELLLGELLGAWNRLMSGSSAVKERKRTGHVGAVKAVEVTHGRNGWHPHLHVLLFLDSDEPPNLAERWAKQVTKTGRKSPHAVHGLDVKLCTRSGELGQYITKVEGDWGVGMELARADAKTARKGSRSPWQILRSATIDGDIDDLNLFLEYERATKGKHALQWSRGLKGLLGVKEMTDEEAAVQEAEDEVLVTRRVDASEWAKLLKNQRICDLYEEIEDELERLIQVSDRSPP